MGSRRLKRYLREEGFTGKASKGPPCISNRWKKQGMSCLLSRKGNGWDNTPTERLFSRLKREWLADNNYRIRKEAVTDVRRHMTYCNSNCLHTAQGHMVPIGFEKRA